MKAKWVIVLVLLTGCDFFEPKQNTWRPEIVDPSSGQIRTMTEAETAGKYLIINYWAAWCKPCITEIPELNQFAEQHKDQVIVLGMNFDHLQTPALQTAVAKAGIHYWVLAVDPAAPLALPEISGLPTTVVLDGKGKIKTTLLGPQTLASLEAALSAP